jgi:excisionase family DNA binding protein
MEKLLTVKEIATILKLEPQSVRMNLRAGAIKAFRLNDKGWRVREEDLKKFIKDSYDIATDDQRKYLNQKQEAKK